VADGFTRASAADSKDMAKQTPGWDSKAAAGV
jgi:hypothetical protein